MIMYDLLRHFLLTAVWPRGRLLVKRRMCALQVSLSVEVFVVEKKWPGLFPEI